MSKGIFCLFELSPLPLHPPTPLWKTAWTPSVTWLLLDLLLFAFILLCLCVSSLHPLRLLGILTSVWQLNLLTTTAWWILTQYAGNEQCLSNRQREKKIDQMVHCIFLTRRSTQQPGFITSINKSMNESWQAPTGPGTREAWFCSTINSCQYFSKLLIDVHDARFFQELII